MKFRFFTLLFLATIFSACQSKKDKELDHSLYEIIAKEHNTGIDSYHILYKGNDLSEESLKEFIQLFRAQKASESATISLYNDSSIGNLVLKFPLTPEEYLFIADHFIVISDYNQPESVLMYPYQDENYKQLGGTNWKKKPVE